MEQSNKSGSLWRRLVKSRRDLQLHAMRGVASGLGSGAVSLIILWIQSRY